MAAWDNGDTDSDSESMYVVRWFGVSCPQLSKESDVESGGLARRQSMSQHANISHPRG